MSVSLSKDARLAPNPNAEISILREAVEALQALEDAQRQQKEAEAHVKALCRSYSLAAGVWGFAPHHLRQACQARGLL